MQEPIKLSVKDYANYKNVTVAAIYSRIKNKTLKSVKEQGKTLILLDTKQDIKAYNTFINPVKENKNTNIDLEQNYNKEIKELHKIIKGLKKSNKKIHKTYKKEIKNLKETYKEEIISLKQSNKELKQSNINLYERIISKDKENIENIKTLQKTKDQQLQTFMELALKQSEQKLLKHDDIVINKNNDIVEADIIEKKKKNKNKKNKKN